MTPEDAGAGRKLRLLLLAGRFAVCRLGPRDPAPATPAQAGFFSITRTREELSIVCAEEAVPAGSKAEIGWACLQVEGPLPFEMTGVVAALAAPLAAGGVPLFVVSTFDTDYLLVKQERLEEAAAILTRAGHEVHGGAEIGT